MHPDDLTPRQHLLMALEYYGIGILEEGGRIFQLEKEYSVEIEDGFLFKLLWKGKVVAPFDRLDDLCQHIKAS
ncbi:MAG: hypothetical protein AAFQ37_03860 [Bacteroidota bacterium]